jgi:TolB protein
VWSLDSGRIVFAGRTADWMTSIYRTDPSGTFFDELTEHDWSASRPAWSGDGGAIAFTYSPQGLTRRIYLMDPDGGDVRRLTNPPAPHADYGPTWSPADDAIAFTSSRGGVDRQGVYTVSLDGGAETRLTELDRSAKWPSWRPTGDAIVYASSRVGFLDIHVMDGKGRHVAQLTDRDRLDMTPSWHPRGKAVAFSSGSADARIGDGDIRTIEADGSGERLLTTHPADDIDPCWSPDGTEILFPSQRDGPRGLFIINVNDLSIRRVTEGIWGQFRAIDGSSWGSPALSVNRGFP